MTLITPAAPEQPTPDELLRRARLTIDREINELFTAVLGTYTRLMAMVWRNPLGFTPQQVLDRYGTSAVELFRLAATLRACINAAVPGTVDETPAPVTINPDGTVTVNMPPAEPAAADPEQV